MFVVAFWSVALVVSVVAVLAFRLRDFAGSTLTPSVILFGHFAILAVWPLSVLTIPESKRPSLISGTPTVKSVILITIDTLRADSLVEQPTPYIDSLAADAISFRNAISGGSWTVPGLASLITGTGPLAHGQLTLASPPLDEKFPTVGHLMSQAGYVTALVGENPYLLGRGMQHGFHRIHAHPHPPAGRSFGWVALENFSERFHRYPGVERIVEWSIDWIVENSDKNFFLWNAHLRSP